jgi:uncharacterized protein
MRLPEQVIERKEYLEKVKPFIGKQLIKVFTGQRRVGKSYLLYQLINYIKRKDKNARIIYINKEDIHFSHIQNAKHLHDYVLTEKSKKQKTYVFIDEIQDIEQFEEALRSLLLDNSLDLYCTGSNAEMLSSDVAGHLSGRYIEFTVYSLSYAEFIHFHQLEDTSEALENYMKYGGLPYLIHLGFENHVALEYLKNIYHTIVYKDIIHRYQLRNTLFLERLVIFLAAHTGSLFSAKKISDFLQAQKISISTKQVLNYIHYLSCAFIIQPASRYDIKGKRLFEFGEKYYFENIGIRNGIWGYRAEDRGKIMENLVYNQLKYSGYEVQIGVIGDKEIDFVAKKNGEIHYYQVALSINDEKTMQREIGNLELIDDNYPKTLITMEYFSGNSKEGIKIIGLREFLMM